MDFILSTIKRADINIINSNINNVHNVVDIIYQISIHLLIIAFDYFGWQQIVFPILMGNANLLKFGNDRSGNYVAVVGKQLFKICTLLRKRSFRLVRGKNAL